VVWHDFLQEHVRKRKLQVSAQKFQPDHTAG